MRVCLDTNVLVSGIFWKGIPGKIIDRWIEGQFELVVSFSILEEYKRVLKDLGGRDNQELAELWIKKILEKASIVAASPKLGKWSRDAQDDKFIHCALASHADYLVTGDQDLLELKDRSGVKILTPKEFLKKIK